MQTRYFILRAQASPDALNAALDAAEIARTLDRTTYDTSLTNVALHLSIAGRFDEALPVAMQCLDSPGLAQSSRISVLPSAARSLAGLGRFEEALRIVEMDFGPMIGAQRAARRRHQLTSLASILHELDQLDGLEHLAALTMALPGAGDGDAVRLHLGEILGGDDALAQLSTPAPSALAENRIDALVESVIADIRKHGDADTAGLSHA